MMFLFGTFQTGEPLGTSPGALFYLLFVIGLSIVKLYWPDER